MNSVYKRYQNKKQPIKNRRYFKQINVAKNATYINVTCTNHFGLIEIY